MAGAEAIRMTVRSGTNIFGEPAAILVRTEARASRRARSIARFGFCLDLDLWCRLLARRRPLRARRGAVRFPRLEPVVERGARLAPAAGVRRVRRRAVAPRRAAVVIRPDVAAVRAPGSTPCCVRAVTRVLLLTSRSMIMTTANAGRDSRRRPGHAACPRKRSYAPSRWSRSAACRSSGTS